jgi:hypothetical protein
MPWAATLKCSRHQVDQSDFKVLVISAHTEDAPELMISMGLLSFALWRVCGRIMMFECQILSRRQVCEYDLVSRRMSVMNKQIFAVVTSMMVIAGCASDVTSGKRVFITPSDSAHISNCKMLGQVQVDATITMLWDRNQMVMEIKNRLRDATANKFPSADTVTHSDLNVGLWSAPDAQAMGTAFKCFDR